MANETNLEIVIYQKKSDPADPPEAAGAIWINLQTGAFFVSREVTNAGETSLEWFKEGNISETQFRELFDKYAPLATREQLIAGGLETRVSITPALLKATILAIAPDKITQEEFNNLLNAFSPLATKAEAEAGTSKKRRDFTPERIKQAIMAAAISRESFGSITQGTFTPTINKAAAQDIKISFRNRTFGSGKVDAREVEHVIQDGKLVPRTLQIDLEDVRENGFYFLDIEKVANVRDKIRLRLDGAPLTDVHFGGVASEEIEELMNEGVIKVAILVNTLPDGATAGVANGIVLPQEFSTQKVFDVLNNIEDAQSFNALDKLLVLQPIEEGRPNHSNSVNFSKESSDPVTISQDGTENDFIERTFDDRSGSANPNKTVFMLTTEGVVNAYTPQMQMEEGDAGPDLPEISRKTLVLTDQRNRPLHGALFVDPNEPKIILVVRINEFNLDFHFGTSRRVTATYREIPGAAPGRIAGGFLKMRGESGYTESGVYIFNILAPDRDDIFPNAGTVNGMRLKITSLPSLLPSGEYTSHLNLFLADLNFTNVVVGQEVKALPENVLDQRFDEKVEGQVAAVENRLHGEIENLKELVESIRPSAFKMVPSSISVVLSSARIPAVGAQFDITFSVEGAEHAPAGDFLATIDGIPLAVVQPPRVSDGPNNLTVSIADEATRGNVARNAGDGQANFQIRKGKSYSDILHVPIATS